MIEIIEIDRGGVGRGGGTTGGEGGGPGIDKISKHSLLSISKSQHVGKNSKSAF